MREFSFQRCRGRGPGSGARTRDGISRLSFRFAAESNSCTLSRRGPQCHPLSAIIRLLRAAKACSRVCVCARTRTKLFSEFDAINFRVSFRELKFSNFVLSHLSYLFVTNYTRRRLRHRGSQVRPLSPRGKEERGSYIYIIISAWRREKSNTCERACVCMHTLGVRVHPFRPVSVYMPVLLCISGAG